MTRYFGELRVTRGEEHTFLGMNIKVGKHLKIEIEMKDQLKETIEMYTEFEGLNIEEIVTSPAQKYLRDNNNECAKLPDTKVNYFIQ